MNAWLLVPHVAVWNRALYPVTVIGAFLVFRSKTKKNYRYTNEKQILVKMYIKSIIMFADI